MIAFLIDLNGLENLSRYSEGRIPLVLGALSHATLGRAEVP